MLFSYPSQRPLCSFIAFLLLLLALGDRSAIAQQPSELDLGQPTTPEITPLPESILAPEDALPLPEPPQVQPQLAPELAAETITVTRFEILGNPTVFSIEELTQKLNAPGSGPDDPKTPLLSVQNQTFTLQQLLKLPQQVVEKYQKLGYSTSGAILVLPDQGEGVVGLEIIEGTVEEIQVARVTEAGVEAEDSSAFSSLQPRYVRARLGLKPNQPLNINRLQERLQLLQLDPNIDQISAELSTGSATGRSRLRVQFDDTPSLSTQLALDNSRSPSIGTVQRQVSLGQRNLLGLGDRFNFAYSNTEGSHGFDVGYAIPINARDGTLSFNYNNTSSRVIESPFGDVDKDGDDGDIESSAQSYELTFRQPLLRSIKNRTFQEFSLGLTTSFRSSQTKLLDIPFPLSAGADDEGRTNIFALRFFQDWNRQDAKSVLALRSQFNLGLDALGATINDPIAGVDDIPDSRFFSWQGQAQWVRLLAPDMPLIARGSVQLADRALLSAEQFAVGGLGSVRGYRQDVLQSDNGLLASLEVRLPLWRSARQGSTLQLTPFVDYGTAWSNSGEIDLESTHLASTGLGLRWQQGDRLTARLDYGIPLIHLNSRKQTWQENGLLFSVRYNLF